MTKIDFQKELNEEQYRVVTSANGPHLVLAGAGSGKTRTLVYRVAWLIKRGVDPSKILLLTFTNKAANEMMERVKHILEVPNNKTISLWEVHFTLLHIDFLEFMEIVLIFQRTLLFLMNQMQNQL